MRPYGYSRRDKLECQYGCCTFKGGRKKNCRVLVDRSRRKAARRVVIEGDAESFALLL